MELLEGTFAVQLARKAIEDWTLKGLRPLLKCLPEEFKEKSGVFVTLNTYPEGELRGCIGYMESVYPLAVGIINAAISACADPRFSRLDEDELDKVTVEVSIVTKPKLIEVEDPKDYQDRIKVGRDGLIVQRGVFKGLLLPQVAVEHRLDARDFLSETCVKAGMKALDWKDPKTKVYKFKSTVFAEARPGGVVAEKRLE